MPHSKRTKLPPKVIAKRYARLRPEYRDPNRLKECPCCRQHLPVSAFYESPGRGDWCSAYCKACDTIMCRLRRRKTRELKRILVANGAGAYRAARI
jgi:hypothetical protein